MNELDLNESSNLYFCQTLVILKKQLSKGIVILKKQLLLVEVNSEVHEFINRNRRECDGEDKMQG
jgi:hypothetical protein